MSQIPWVKPQFNCDKWPHCQSFFFFKIDSVLQGSFVMSIESISLNNGIALKIDCNVALVF